MRKQIVQRLVVDVPSGGAERDRDDAKARRLNPLSTVIVNRRGEETTRPHSQVSRRNRHDASGRRPNLPGTRRWSKLARSLRAHADGRR
jgi:hypothetical protein